MGYFSPRSAKTTLSCPKCGKELDIRRGCREVHLECPACGQTFPLKDYIGRADVAMENFLENVYCDRM